MQDIFNTDKTFTIRKLHMEGKMKKWLVGIMLLVMVGCGTTFQERKLNTSLTLSVGEHLIETGRLDEKYQDDIDKVRGLMDAAEEFHNAGQLNLRDMKWQEALLLAMEIDKKIIEAKKAK